MKMKLIGGIGEMNPEEVERQYQQWYSDLEYYVRKQDFFKVIEHAAKLIELSTYSCVVEGYANDGYGEWINYEKLR